SATGSATGAPKAYPYQVLAVLPPTLRSPGVCCHTSLTNPLNARWDTCGIAESLPFHVRNASYKSLVGSATPSARYVDSAKNDPSQSCADRIVAVSALTCSGIVSPSRSYARYPRTAQARIPSASSWNRCLTTSFFILCAS